MEANFLKSRLEQASRMGQGFTLLLRGAHVLDVEGATVTPVDGDSEETRFQIAGRIGADGRASVKGTVFVTSGDIAALLVRDA